MLKAHAGLGVVCISTSQNRGLILDKVFALIVGLT